MYIHVDLCLHSIYLQAELGKIYRKYILNRGCYMVKIK